MAEPRVRALRRSEADLRRFQAAFAADGVEKSLAHLRWQFFDAPGGELLVDVAEVDDPERGKVLAAIYAVYSLRLHLEGATVPAVQSLDTLTDRQFRGQGWFPRLAASVYARAAERGNALVYGFPNANSARGFFEKLGWTRLDPVPMLVRPLRTGAALRWAGWPAVDLPIPVRRHRFRRVDIAPLDRFDERFDALWDRFAARIPVAVRRDAAWANWRLVDRPDSVYQRRSAQVGGELAGFVAWRETRKEGGGVGYLMELVAEPPWVARSLLAAALREMRDAGIDLVQALCMPGGPTWEAHLAEGFVPLPERFRRTELHFGARALDPAAQRATDRRSWYLSLTDSDTI